MCFTHTVINMFCYCLYVIQELERTPGSTSTDGASTSESVKGTYIWGILYIGGAILYSR